jgi:hypothetical protein
MDRRSRWARRVGVALFALGGFPAVVRAHNVAVGRFDAPVPLPLLFAGAGGTVALTALWLARAGAPPSALSTRPLLTVETRTVRSLRAVARGGFLLAVVAAVVAGVAGRQVAAENVATLFTWPVWVRGLGLVAVLVGSPWRALSPWRTLYRGLCRLEGDRIALLGDPPPWLGSWPALVGFVVLVGVVEGLTVVPRSPALTAVVVSAYGLATVGGAVLVGPSWFERADPLEAFYRLFGRVAPLGLERAGPETTAVVVRPPWVGCRAPVSETALVAFAVATVYTVSFDGFANTRPYGTLRLGVAGALGTGPPTGVLLYVAGLVVFVATFAAATRGGDALAASGADAVVAGGSARADGGVSAARAFAPTLLPIAAAYDVAHNYPAVATGAARLVEVALRPLGVAPALDPLWWLSVPAFWGSQVALVVAGHLVAVVAAHRVAADRYPAATVRRGHLPLAALMVGYTVLSLWVVSRPVVA